MTLEPLVPCSYECEASLRDSDLCIRSDFSKYVLSTNLLNSLAVAQMDQWGVFPHDMAADDR